MSENKKDIEIFDGEEDVTIEPIDNVELYDINGNLITAKDAKNSLPDNTELIQKAIDGDRDAFNTLYMQSYRYVFFVVKNYIPDDETAYDVIQETFIKVYKNISKLRSPAAYYGWITVIAKNTACDFVRAAHFESPLSYEQEDYRDFLNDDATEKDVSLDIETVLKKLSSEEAELLSLVYYDGMSISQIAKMQGVPATTVYSRFNKAKKNLKVQLNAHGIDKAIYSGNFMAMITTAMRNIIGTALLSVAIAQQILDSIINGKGKKEIAIAKIIKSQQKKSILKIASVIVAISMITSALTAFTLIDWTRFKFFGDDSYLNETSTVTEYYYETDSNSGGSSNNGGFWGGLFGGNNTSSSSSTTANNPESSSFNPYYSNDSSTDSSKTNSSNNTNINGSTPSYLTPNNSIPTDDTDQPAEVVNVFGTHPNNVTGSNFPETYDPLNSIKITGYTGLVAKQGDWLYYVQQGGRIMRVKTDGSDSQMIVETKSSLGIQCLNVVGDTVYYINGGIWSIKVDGTEQKQYTTKTAKNLLVRGTTGWFIENNGIQYPDRCIYTLYQVDFLTGNITTLVQDAQGYGLKTVIDNKLIYAIEDEIYTRDLVSGNEQMTFKISDHAKDLPSGVNVGVRALNIDNSGNLYIEQYVKYLLDGNYLTDGTYKINLNNPSVVQAFYDKIGYNFNYFDYNGGIFFSGLYQNPYECSLRDAQGNDLYKGQEYIGSERGVYGFDDGYVYFINIMSNGVCRYDLSSGETVIY